MILCLFIVPIAIKSTRQTSLAHPEIVFLGIAAFDFVKGYIFPTTCVDFHKSAVGNYFTTLCLCNGNACVVSAGEGA